ncbi:MAG: NAD(P)-binding domain-containing protein [Ignavibacteriales bacterium]|nr:NAD(P)-binding domain-containing protein [Ignavibacteriales bacterium]
MKIGILGTGGVGRTLAAKLIALGHEVVIGTRNVEDTLAALLPDGMGGPPFKVWHSQNPKAKLVKFSEAASFGEMLFLATFGDKTSLQLKWQANNILTIRLSSILQTH